MKSVAIAVVVSLFMAGSVATDAHEYQVKQLTIGHPWAHATRGGMTNGVVYVTFVNDGTEPDQLTGASSPLAAGAGLHSTTQDGEIARMRSVDSIALPAGKTTELKPGGLHIMLTGLKKPLKPGDNFPMTLTLANEGKVTIQVMVAD
jgi:copper(I)-binding protein